MFSHRSSALAVVLLLLAGPVLSVPLDPSAPAGATGAPAPGRAQAPPPFGIGDWVVTGTETMKDGALLLDGNLTIESGGSLTLVNSTIQMLCRQGSVHDIRVRSGGELKVLSNSVIGAFDPTFWGYTYPGFWIDAGARASFENSSFLSVGIKEYWIDDSEMGGIFIRSPMTVRNCTFNGSRTAVTVFNSDAVFEHCSFEGSEWAGVVSYQSNTVFRNCTFARDYAGAVPYRSNTLFENCSFHDNFLGVIPDSTTCELRNCNFSRNSYVGLYCNPQMGINIPPYASSVTVKDCHFIANRIGIGALWSWADAGGAVFPLWHDIFMTNCEFRDSVTAGMLWPRSEPDLTREQSPCTWTMTARGEVRNDTIDFNGKIAVEQGGELALDHAKFSLDPGFAGWNGIEVKGALTVRDSTVLSTNASAPYYLACRPSSRFQMAGSTLRRCGWELQLLEHAGPFIETDALNISGSWINDCPVALVLHSSGGGRVERSRLDGRALGIWMNMSDARISNSSMGCASLEGGSVLECVNTSFPAAELTFYDLASRVEMGWYLDLAVAWDDGRPVAGANVTVNDTDGAGVFNGTAGGDGRLPLMTLWEATYSLNGSVDHTPHAIDCWRGPVRNTTGVEMLSSKSLVVTLSDRQAPNITVASPLAGAYLNSTEVQVIGTASDGMALQRVSVSVDSGEWQPVFDAGGCETANAAWNTTLRLGDGLHSLEAQAQDSSGNIASAIVSFSVDTVPPDIFITSPSPDHLTNLSEQAVGGLVEAGAEVLVNGIRARTTGGSFTAVIRLAEGDNTVTAVATDAAGNTNSSFITVRLDTLPPALAVVYDPPGDYVNRPQLNLSGDMENGSSISVNGRRVVLPGLASSFRTLVFLDNGANIITVVAVDPAGNSNISRRTVVLDTDPPYLEILYPPDGLLTPVSVLPMQLVAEGGSKLAIGDRTMDIPGATGARTAFNLTMDLLEGPNDMVLRARDAAGNTFVASRHVVLDTIAPALAISSPLNGSRTSNDSIYVVGQAEPGASVTVQGEPVMVGYSGSFSAEVRLGVGVNRILVHAQDAAGNHRELNLTVTKVPGKAGEPVVVESRLDWAFAAFLVIAAAAVVAEGAWMRRYLERRRKGGGRTG